MKFAFLEKIPVVLLLAGLLAAGCSSSSTNRLMNEEMIAPKPPAFLTGGAAALLTNSAGISAQLTLDRQPGKPLTGTLLVSGSHLLFAPAGDRTFMWDVATHSGYVVSDSMQSYAPISATPFVIGVVIKSETAGPLGSKINGEAGHLAEIMVNLNDGTHQDFAVWRTTQWQGFPSQIKPRADSTTDIINLDKIRRDSLSLSLFQPPAGFTAYPTLEAMTGEYIMRRSKLNTKGTITHPHDDTPAHVTPGGGPGHY